MPSRTGNAGRPRGATPDKLQLLGVAFASADVAFELDRDGRFTFAVGATSPIFGADGGALTGREWRDFMDPTDAPVLALILADLAPGERRGGIRLSCVSIGSGKTATEGELAVFRLPDQRDRISCAFSRRPNSAPSGQRRREGLLDRNGFEETAARVLAEADRSAAPLHLDLVELAGFEASTLARDPAAGASARRDVIAALRAGSHGGFAAAELAPDRFAVMRSADAGQMMTRLGQITGSPVTASSQLLSADVSPAHSLRAVRYALDRHIEAGPAAAESTFQTVLEATLRRASQFTSRLAAGDVGLVFQPVVDLATRRPHHFEALARFDEDSSPEDLIRLAEELGLITEFDIAVFASVADTLRTLGAVKIAVNLSGHSLVNPGFVDRLLALTEGEFGLRQRLIIEITETHLLGDLEAADALIDQLQQAGHTVCLDDFGAGAASLDYLRRLKVDVVKIDGRYIRALPENRRTQLIVQHVIRLCRDLSIEVIGEMVENEETAELLAGLGAQFGQGWLFGKPTTSPHGASRNHARA